MRRVTPTETRSALDAVGVAAGDILYVASFAAMLGRDPTVFEETIDALLDAVGPAGTVIMPTFHFGFCRGEPFDPLTTPSTTGVLTEAFRRRPQARRTVSPPYHSVAAIGARADEIATIYSRTSFGRGSVWHWMWREGARHLLLGCRYSEGVPHFHWLEELFEVPYRYWKQFRGTVRISGRNELRTYWMYARRLDFPESDLRDPTDELGAAFERAGSVRCAPLGLGTVRAFLLSDFHDFFAPLFERDLMLVAPNEARPHYGQSTYNPVQRLHHIAVLAPAGGALSDLVPAMGYRIAFEGRFGVPEWTSRFYRGHGGLIEAIDSADGANGGIHHLAFEVGDLRQAIDWFAACGWKLVEGSDVDWPTPGHRSVFLRAVKPDGPQIELVACGPS